MTNWEYYKDSYQLAAYAYDVWCTTQCKQHNPFCDDPTACEICHARWYTLEWKQSEFDAIKQAWIAECNGEWHDSDWESNDESEARISKIIEKALLHRQKIAKEHGYSDYKSFLDSLASKKKIKP